MKNKAILVSVILAVVIGLMSGCGGGKNVEEMPSPSPEVTIEPTSSPEPEALDVDVDGAEKQEQTAASAAENVPKATSKPKPTASSAPTQTPETKPVQTSAPAPEQTPEKTPVPTPVVSISADELMGKMIAALPADSHNLSEMPEELYESLYQINPADYDGVAIYGSMINVRANEIIVIKAKNESGVAAAKAAMSNRLSALDEIWKRYLPDQYELVKSGKIISKGCYAAMVVAKDGDKAVNAFYAALN